MKGQNSTSPVDVGTYESQKPSSSEKKNSLKTSQILTPESIAKEVRYTEGGYVTQEKKRELSIQIPAYTIEITDSKRSEDQTVNQVISLL